jgi:hypothetical protein
MTLIVPRNVIGFHVLNPSRVHVARGYLAGGY